MCKRFQMVTPLLRKRFMHVVATLVGWLLHWLVGEEKTIFTNQPLCYPLKKSSIHKATRFMICLLDQPTRVIHVMSCHFCKLNVKQLLTDSWLPPNNCPFQAFHPPFSTAPPPSSWDPPPCWRTHPHRLVAPSGWNGIIQDGYLRSL